MLDPARGVTEARTQYPAPVPELARPARVVVDDADDVATAIAALRGREAGPDLRHHGAGERDAFRQRQLVRQETTLSCHQFVEVDDRGTRPLDLTQATPGVGRSRPRLDGGGRQPGIQTAIIGHRFSIPSTRRDSAARRVAVTAVCLTSGAAR